MKVARHFQAKQVHMGRLAQGADIIRSLEDYACEHGIRAGWVNILGALEKATISYYDQKTHQYYHHPMAGEYEIVSCSGNISLKDGKPFAHIHIVLSDTEYKAWGGHLWPDSSAVFAAEFVLFELKGSAGDMGLERCPDAETGLALW